MNNPTLYVVATPLGNLRDLSPRAVEILRSVDLVLCEDTRHFAKLAQSYRIETKRQSFHDHNEGRLVEEIVSRISAGASIALVSDAGTPLISDPGYRLLKAAREHAIPVVPIPGPCAAIAALSICGFEVNRFVFEGFLPQKGAKRAREIERILTEGTTAVIYESPYRVLKLVEQIAQVDPQRELFLARELTKLHEEHFRGPAATLLASISKHSPRGEYVMVVRGKPDRQLQEEIEEDDQGELVVTQVDR